MKIKILDYKNKSYEGWTITIGDLYDESYKDKYVFVHMEDLEDDDCFLIPISVAGLKGYLSIFGENDGKTFLDIFSDRIKKLVKENNGFILVSWFAEGHITQQNYKDLHNELKKHNIPANKIMFLASDMNGNIQYDKFCDRNNIKDKIHIFEASHRLEAYSYIYNYITQPKKVTGYDKSKLDNIHPYSNSFFSVDEMFEMKNSLREKYFLSYNRIIREYRLALVAMIYEMGLQDKGIISLGAPKINEEYGGTWPTHIGDFIKDKKQNEMVSSALKKIKSLCPIVADQDILPETVFSSDGEHISIGDWTNFSHQYKRVYFNVVTESCYYDECIYFSEKTFKPIGQLTPFILMSTPYSLAKLREIGFKTFDGWIDESYDKEEDNDKRFFMIIEVIKNLCGVSREELHDWYYSLTDILIHNQKTLRDYQPLQDTLDMKSPDRIRIWNEISEIIS
jgi:hypothetical protein